MRKFSIRKIIVSAYLPAMLFALCFSGPEILAQRVVKLGDLRVNFRKTPKKERKPLLKMLKRLNRVIAEVREFRDDDTGESEIKCMLLFVDRKIPGDMEVIALRGNNVMIYLNSNSKKWEEDYNLQKKLLATLMMVQCGIVPRKETGTPPDWLLTALLKKAAPKTSTVEIKIPGLGFYPELYTMLASDCPPDLWKLLENPIKPEDGAGFRVYAETCEFLLSSCNSLLSRQKSKDSPFTEMIYLAARKNYSQSQIFKLCFGKFLIDKAPKLNYTFSEKDFSVMSDREKIQAWFESNLRRKIMNFFMPAPANFALERFEDSMQVEAKIVSLEDKSSGYERFPLEDTPKYWPEVANKNLVIAEIKKKMVGMRFELPEDFHPALVNIETALTGLGMNQAKNFTENIKNAKKQFLKAYHKRIALEKYLRETDATKVPPGIRYGMVMECLRQLDLERRKFWPSLNDYLDKVEKKYHHQ